MRLPGKTIELKGWAGVRRQRLISAVPGLG